METVVKAYSVAAPGAEPVQVAKITFTTSESLVYLRFFTEALEVVSGLVVTGGSTTLTLRKGGLSSAFRVTAHVPGTLKAQALKLVPSVGEVTVPLSLPEPVMPPVGTEPLFPTPPDPVPSWGPRSVIYPLELVVTLDGQPADSTFYQSQVLDGDSVGGRGGVLVAGKGVLTLRSIPPAEPAWITLQKGASTYWGSFFLPEGSAKITLNMVSATGVLNQQVDRKSPSSLALHKYTGKVKPQVAFGYVAPVIYTVEVQITKDAEQTPSVTKTAVMLPDESSTSPAAVFLPKDGFSAKQTFSQAIAREWFFNVRDTEPPRAGILRWPTITGNQILRFDLSTGDSSGGGGDEGTIDAVVTVSGVPASRDLVIVEQDANGDWRVVGFTKTNADGMAKVEVKVLPDTKVYGMATDDYGIVYAPNLAVVEGQRLRPTVFAGWLYEVTQAGQLPSVEPDWWPASDVNPSRLVGTVWLKAVRYYQPVAHGPVPAEFV